MFVDDITVFENSDSTSWYTILPYSRTRTDGPFSDFTGILSLMIFTRSIQSACKKCSGWYRVAQLHRRSWTVAALGFANARQWLVGKGCGCCRPPIANLPNWKRDGVATKWQPQVCHVD
jgi:hypothetical protein